ncbi:MAG: hypothetical protein U9O65_01610 [Thermotogota bacterium]|nr:hypothetical protein [Thermotogota bacterium]
MRIKKTVAFRSPDDSSRLLFRILNIGKQTDELKFQFIESDHHSAVTYSEDKIYHSKSDILAAYAEISYHNDGTLLHKFPKPFGESEVKYINPHGIGERRTPLYDINKWESVIRLTIGKYSLCHHIDAPDCLVENQSIFNEDPFVCVIYLGHMKYALPPNNGSNEQVFRVNNIAKNVDMALWFYKTSYSVRKKIIEGTDISTVVTGNVIEIVETNI